jgi:Fe-S cluster assembly iron-binding protein IscA
MLILTSSATTVIRSVFDGSELPEGGGLRIASTHNGTENFTVQPAAGPEAGDQIVEDGGARVFLEPSAASMLGDTVLDADVDEEGQIQFLLTAQVGGS